MCDWQSEDCGPFSDTKTPDPSICPTAFQWCTNLVHEEQLSKQRNSRSTISPSIHSADNHGVPWCTRPYSGTGNEEAISFLMWFTPTMRRTTWWMWARIQEPDSWDHILTLPLASCVTLDTLPNFSVPQFVHLNRVSPFMVVMKTEWADIYTAFRACEYC